MRVRVKSPARLHLGLLELGDGMGRIYGGMGVAVEKPFTEIEVEPNEKLQVEGDAGPIQEVVDRLGSTYGIEPRVRIRVINSIPAHVGLGSRTQLTLAIATGITQLYGIKATVDDLARILGLGRISGIGTAVFRAGGFVLDGGRRIGSDGLPPILIQRPFPRSWAFTIAIPGGMRGPTDAEEEYLFGMLPKMDDGTVGRLCRLTLVKLLPALVEEDIASFGEALTDIQRILGGYFSTVQGGVFANPQAEEISDMMSNMGAVAVGQSSWGPSLYGLYPSIIRAESAAEQLIEMLGAGWNVVAASPFNRGAEILVTS
jgi:beta-ribofuranosylaminobenzene 5'-phosphate synthase